jgi:hypothetical protein
MKLRTFVLFIALFVIFSAVILPVVQPAISKLQEDAYRPVQQYAISRLNDRLTTCNGYLNGNTPLNSNELGLCIPCSAENTQLFSQGQPVFLPGTAPEWQQYYYLKYQFEQTYKGLQIKFKAQSDH